MFGSRADNLFGLHTLDTMPVGDPASVLHKCISLVGRWTPEDLSVADDVLRELRLF